jgi:tetratricopeptide (TPR) repeat protein
VKKIFIILAAAMMLPFNMAAQHLLVNQAKKDITGLTMTVDSYNKAFNKLKPALTNDATRNQAETWALASRIKVELFDKYMDNRRVGKKIDIKAMGHSLIDAYDYSLIALKLDTIHILDKKGNPVIDKKSKRPKVRTKYSKDVVNRLAEHHDDYRMAGSDLYNIKDWDGAYTAWDYFCQMAARSDDRRWAKPDSIVAEVRYYQGIAAWQKADTIDAVRLFSIARHSGYNRKEAYDYALVCLSDLGNEAEVVKLAGEAFVKFGTSDPQYIRILINDYINHEEYESATDLIDEAIEANPNDDELLNLKGLIVENQQSIYEALPYYQRCIELNDSNASGQFNVGRYFYNKAMETRQNSNLYGKKLANLVNPIYREALPYLEKSFAINPRNQDLINALRDIYYKLGEAAKLQAIEEYSNHR